MATESRIQSAFLSGVRSITNAARVADLKDAISRGDYQAVIDAVDIDDAAFDEFRNILVQTYADGGISEISGMPYKFRPRWNSATSHAEYYARNVIGSHITVITDDMREAVRWTVGDGVAYGRSVDRIALDIVGRKVGANRVGGIVGLNQQQAQWVANMRRKLSDDPLSVLRDYTKRDRRFDGIIMRAADGKPLTSDQIDRISRAYSDRLLRVRGMTIARTERNSAINSGRQESWRQAADKFGLPYSSIWKEWRHSRRKMEPRINHILSDGQRVYGLDSSFDIGGYYCLHPHDPTLPAGEVINCGCTVKYGIG